MLITRQMSSIHANFSRANFDHREGPCAEEIVKLWTVGDKIRWNELAGNDADTEDYFGPGSDSEDQLCEFSFATLKQDIPDFTSQIYKALLVDGNPIRSRQLLRQFGVEYEAQMESLISKFTRYRDEGLPKTPGLQSAAADVIVVSKPTNEPARSSRVSPST